MTTFLSQDNAQYISGMFQKFMQDKYQFRYSTVIKEEDFLKLLGNTMTRVYKDYSHQYEPGDLNKVTVSELKKYFLDNYLSKPSGPAPPIPPPPLPTIVSPSVGGILEPIVEEGSAFSEDSEFFNRLQKLEFQRKTFVPLSSATNTSVFIPAEQNTPAQHASSQVPSAITTVFMPSPIKIGKELKLFSWQRDWIYETDRNYFTWKGPLSKQMDRTSTRVGCMICPSSLLQETNMVSLLIEGANEDEVSVTLIPSHAVGDYTIFRPILESLSYLRLLALPWKVSLESGDGEKLFLGKDAVPYMLQNESTLLVSKAFDFCKGGDSLRIYIEATKKIIAVRVKTVQDNEIEIVGRISGGGGGLLLNYSRQISIVFETTSSEHKN